MEQKKSVFFETIFEPHPQMFLPPYDYDYNTPLFLSLFLPKLTILFLIPHQPISAFHALSPTITKILFPLCVLQKNSYYTKVLFLYSDSLSSVRCPLLNFLIRGENGVVGCGLLIGRRRGLLYRPFRLLLLCVFLDLGFCLLAVLFLY